MTLVSRVRELEARLAAAATTPQPTPASTPQARHSLEPPPSDAGARAAAPTPESTADAIATGLFDHPPVVDIGYFGSSSNHAFFWSLSASIENVSRRSACRFHEPLSRQPPPVDGPPRQPGEPTDAAPAPDDDDSFPGPRLAVAWTTRFFETVGAVLPYIGEPEVFREIDRIDSQEAWQSASRATQALLSIIFAQALYSLGGGGSPEPYYRRALSLLDEKTVYVPTIEALQALLLLASFQQNTQRSMESWTPHYRAVRVSYQLGIHAPASYEYLGTHDRMIRSRLWLAVVNQDRILTAGLARPCLIPLQHVRMELAQFMDPPRQNRTTDASRPKESLVYYRHLIGLHELLAVTVDTIYSSNISSASRLALGDLVAKTVDLSWRLEQWRESTAPPAMVGAGADFGVWSASAFDAERYAILLSIFHYRTIMLQHGSLLMRVLERVTGATKDASSGALQDAALSLLSNYLRALRDWLRLINGILRHGHSFLSRNAVWWTSNYMMLSTCIHTFAFWLLSAHLVSSEAILHMSTSDVEALLGHSLATLKLLGGTSIMSRKAHRCLQRYAHFLKSLRPPASEADSMLSAPASDVAMATPGGGGERPVEDRGPMPPLNPPDLPQWTPVSATPEGLPSAMMNNDVIASCINMFGSLDPNDFMNKNFFGLEQAISDFDAAGFI